MLGIRNAVIKCDVRDKNTHVEWIKDNQVLRNDNKYEIYLNGNQRWLIIKNPTRADNGEYTCQSGKHRVVLNLNVKPPGFGKDTSPSLNIHNYSSDEESFYSRNKKLRSTSSTTINSTTNYHYEEELIYYEKQSACLKCHISKQDDEHIEWLKDDKRLWGSNFKLNEDKYSSEYDGGARVLVIKDLSQQDTGNYACQSRTNPKSRVEFKVNIKEPRPEFVQTLNNIRVTNQNESVTFECITRTPRSVNPYNVKWFKDGKEISNQTDQRYTIFNYYNDEKKDGSVLNFNKLVIQAPINQYDQGEYTVFVDENLKSSANLLFEPSRNSDIVFKPEIYVKKSQLQGFKNLMPNPEDDLIYTETLTYQIDMTDQKQPGSLSPIRESNIQKFSKPDKDLEFTKQLEPFTNCDEGNDCVLECWTNKFDTYAEWNFNNDPVPLQSSFNGGKYEITNQDGRKHRLVIKNSDPSNTGLYSCSINNFLKTSTLLNINEDVPLRIVKGLSDRHVSEFEKNVEFRVETNKSVRNDERTCSIKWFINKNEIKNSPNQYELFCIDNKIFLKFLNEILFDKDNNSQVECRIQELKSGAQQIELRTKCRLIVDKANTMNRFFTKKIDDFIQADSGLHLDMEARVNFDAKSLTKWFKNNVELIPNATYQFIEDKLTRSYMLRINNCKPKDNGIYSIDVDGLQCSGEVKILETPIKFIQKLEDQSYDLETDTSVTLDCQLNKPPSLFNLKPRWFKNDLEITSNHGSQSKYDIVEEHNICALIIYDLEERDEGRYRCQVLPFNSCCFAFTFFNFFFI